MPRTEDIKKINRAAPEYPMIKGYTLSFGESPGFDGTIGSKVMEVYSHKDHQLVTFLFHEFGSFTFKLEDGIDLRRTATYDGELEDLAFTAEIRYDPGTILERFVGHGTDRNQNAFDIEGDIRNTDDVMKKGYDLEGYREEGKKNIGIKICGLFISEDGSMSFNDKI